MTPVSHGKPCAGNPHARFEEGASAPESPRRNALLHETMKNVFRVAVAALMVCAAGTSWAAAKSSTLECAGYTGTTTLTDFQALVKLSEGAYGFSYFDYAAADGSDLWFEDANGTVIPHEIDTWNASGDSFVWVKIPTVVPSTDANFPTAITMHWGAARGPSASATAFLAPTATGAALPTSPSTEQ